MYVCITKYNNLLGSLVAFVCTSIYISIFIMETRGEKKVAQSIVVYKYVPILANGMSKKQNGDAAHRNVLTALRTECGN